MKEKIDNPEKLKRTNGLSFKLNDLELEAFEKYCKKYRIKNRAKFIRETVITAVLLRFDQDYPSLFDSLENIEKPN